MERSELILRFFTEDVGGILITGRTARSSMRTAGPG